METPRIKALNVEIKNLKGIVDKLHGMLSIENLNYNVIESQFEGLRVRNQRLADENTVIEEKIKQNIVSADAIMVQAKQAESEVRAAAAVLLSKAQSRFQTVEKLMDKADKANIKEQLKELEAASV